MKFKKHNIEPIRKRTSQCGDDEIIMKPTDFVVFDPRVPHSASEIFTNEKRLGIDFTVRKK